MPNGSSKIRQGGRDGDIYRYLRSLRDHYADSIRENYPPIPRRVSGYNLDQLIPERMAASTLRARWSAAKARWSRCSKPSAG